MRSKRGSLFVATRLIAAHPIRTCGCGRPVRFAAPVERHSLPCERWASEFPIHWTSLMASRGALTTLAEQSPFSSRQPVQSHEIIARQRAGVSERAHQFIDHSGQKMHLSALTSSVFAGVVDLRCHVFPSRVTKRGIGQDRRLSCNHPCSVQSAGSRVTGSVATAATLGLRVSPMTHASTVSDHSCIMWRRCVSYSALL